MHAKQSLRHPVTVEETDEPVTPKALSTERSKKITSSTAKKTLGLSRKISPMGYSPILDRDASKAIVLASQSVD